MERPFALKAHEESAWLGHFGGVVFDHVCSFQGLADFDWGYFTFEHALDRVGTVENFGHGVIIHWRFVLMSLRDGHLRFPSKQSPNCQKAASAKNKSASQRHTKKNVKMTSA